MKYKSLIMCLTCAFSFCNAQELNTSLLNSKNQPYLVGEINKEGLTSNDFNAWFSKNHDAYSLNVKSINQLKPLLKNCTIKAFMGTWCGDSKKEVPRFYKVLEACNFPIDQLQMIAVSREKGLYKQSPNHEEKGLNIHRVPTFIIYKNAIEVNRIVEHPKVTIEDDLLNIVTVNNYEANYPIVSKVDKILKNDGLKVLKRNRKQLIKSYKNSTATYSHLNTYAYILFGTNRQKEALEVSILNTKLFPKNSRTQQNLANKYLVLGKKNRAKKHFKKALKLDPENKVVTKMLKTL